MKTMSDTSRWEMNLCADATRRHIPINAILELTPLCNMNCDMCFVRLNPEEQNNIGRLRTLEEWKTIADQMQEAGTLFLLLTGGEPLLYPYFKEFYLYLKRLGMILTINTNGTLLDEEWADFFAAHKPRRINITLYGKDSKTYEKLCHYKDGFDKTVRAVHLLKERNVDVKINGSITPSNVNDSAELIQIVKQLDVPWKFDTYMYPASRERSCIFDQNSRLSPELAAKARIDLMQYESDDFYERARIFVEKAVNTDAGSHEPMPVSCRAGRSSFMVSWHGKMRPCVMVTEPEVTVETDGFLKAWNRIIEMTAKVRLSSACSSCRLRNVCQNCAACAKMEAGCYNEKPEYMCRYTEETLRLLQKALENETGGK